LASVTITIRSDGYVDPPTAPIQRNGEIYTLTDNITIGQEATPVASLIIERDNIVLDGAGITIHNRASTPGSIHGITPIPVGIIVNGRDNITIKNIELIEFYYGIQLTSSSNIIIVSNTITASRGAALFLSESSNNSILINDIRENSQALRFSKCNNNIVSGNNITSIHCDWWTFLLSESSNNTISNNTFANNGLFVIGSYGNIVDNNLVNGKPLVCLEGVSGYAVEDAGQVILVDCSSIIIENLSISDTDVGIELWRTNDTTIAQNKLTRNGFGIWLRYSGHNNISKNCLEENSECGIWLEESSDNNIIENNITNNKNFGGLYLKQFSNNNHFYHNYWSSYDGLDANNDGIGDTPYVIDENNVDNFPQTNAEQAFQNLLQKYNDLRNDLTNLTSSYNEYKTSIQSELNYTKNLMYTFMATTTALAVSTIYFAKRKPKKQP